MFKIAPIWYMRLMKIGTLAGLMGIIPAICTETYIWGIADGRILSWVMVIILISFLMPLVFADTRKMLLE